MCPTPDPLIGPPEVRPMACVICESREIFLLIGEEAYCKLHSNNEYHLQLEKRDLARKEIAC